MFYTRFPFRYIVIAHGEKCCRTRPPFLCTKTKNSAFLDLYHENNYLLKKHLASSCYQSKKNYLCNVVVKPIGKKRKTFRY